MGRPQRGPIDFEDDAVKELLERTEKGEPLTLICKDARMPSRAGVYDWLEADAEFSGRFRAARERGIHALAEQCLEIADEKVSDAIQVANKRVRIDTRLRLAGKWLPQIYGEKIDVNHGGEVVHRHDLSAYSADELDTLESLIAKAPDRSGDTGGEGPSRTDRVH